jgi:hypothetical protein
MGEPVGEGIWTRESHGAEYCLSIEYEKQSKLSRY